MNMIKICNKCKNPLPVSEYYKKRNGHTLAVCKKCTIEKSKENYRKNRDARLDYLKSYREEHREKLREQSRAAYWDEPEKHREYSRQYYKNNRESARASQKIYNNKNREMLRKRANEYRKIPHNKIASNYRNRIREILGAKHGYKYIDILGCTKDEFKTYLEERFEDGMTWENHGHDGWHIDHIIPCCMFDLEDEYQLRKCFHYTNMQPLWAEDNHRKGGRRAGR